MPKPAEIILATLLLGLPATLARGEDANTTSLKPIKLADDVTHWEVMDDGDIVIMLRKDGLYARSLSVGKQRKLAAMDEKHPVRPRALSHFVRQLSPTSLGFRSAEGKMGVSASEYTIVNLRSGQQSVVLEDGGIVVPVPIDANSVALLQNVGPTKDGDEGFLRVVKVDLGTHKAEQLHRLTGRLQLLGAEKTDKGGRLRVWLRPMKLQPDSELRPDSKSLQLTVPLDGGKVQEEQVDAQEVRKFRPSFAPRRHRTAANHTFPSTEGRSAVKVNNGRVSIARGTFEADLFGDEEYRATVMPNRWENTTRLAIIKRGGGKRELHVLSLKTMGKSNVATLGEMDTVKGWACNGRYLIVEEFAEDGKDDHGHLVVHEPAKFRKTTLTAPQGRKYINLLGSAGDRFLVLGADLYHEDAIRGTRLYLCDLEDGRRMYEVYEGKLFKIAKAGGKLLFSDFDGETQTFTLYRCPLPEKKKRSRTGSSDK